MKSSVSKSAPGGRTTRSGVARGGRAGDVPDDANPDEAAMRVDVTRGGVARTAVVRRVCVGGALALAIGLGVSCSDSPTGSHGRHPAAGPFVVASLSAPIRQTVYVSLPPGTIPGGTEARLHVERTGAAAVARLVDGGFDPVALAAAVGDTVAVTVQVAAGAPLSYRIVVPRPSRPVVVRTRPPRHKRDVALNATMLVVFSEPIDAASLTADAVQLHTGGAAVAGHPEFADDAHLMAHFVPAAPLAANTDYELVVTEGVRDLDGQALEAAVTVPFTTGTSAVAATGTLQVTTATTGSDVDPDGYWAAIGDVGGYWIRDLPSHIPDLPSSGTVTTPLPAGTYTVTLVGAAVNCAADGGAKREVEVVAGATASVAFHVTCAPLPAPGTLELITATTGSEVDADGYALLIARAPDSGDHHVDIDPAALPSNGTATRTLWVGTYTLTLTGVAVNCAVSGGATRQATVDTGATLAVSFDVGCGPLPPPGAVSSGQLAFVKDGQIYLVNSDRTGLVRLTNTGSGVSNADPAWSPDGRRLAFASDRRGGAWDIYVMDADGSNVVRRTSTGALNANPTWSPDGRMIAFQGFYSYRHDLYLVSADGAETSPERLTTSEGWEPAWSPEGTRIAFVSDSAHYEYTADIFTTSPDGSSITQLTRGYRDGRLTWYRRPSWSPDGRTLALVVCRENPYTACDPGSGVAVMNADGSELRMLAQASGDAKPTWSPDGRTIVFSSANSIEWIRADGGERGVIVADGHSPAWRP